MSGIEQRRKSTPRDHHLKSHINRSNCPSPLHALLTRSSINHMVMAFQNTTRRKTKCINPNKITRPTRRPNDQHRWVFITQLVGRIIYAHLTKSPSMKRQWIFITWLVRLLINIPSIRCQCVFITWLVRLQFHTNPKVIPKLIKINRDI